MQPEKTANGKSLQRSIWITVLAFFLFQAAYFSSLALIFKVKMSRLYLFLMVTLVYHLLLPAGLALVKKEFYLEQTGQPLSRMNLPLLLSFTRLSSVPTALFLLLSMRVIPVLTVILPFLVLVFLTDLFDGILARRRKQTTRIGRIMDSSSDYLNIMAISIVFLKFRLIPPWLFTLFCLRLCIHAGGIIGVYSILGYAGIQVSFLGKASIFAAMGLYGFELMEYLEVAILGHPVLITVLEYIAAGIVALSLIEKLLVLGKTLQEIRKKKIAP